MSSSSPSLPLSSSPQHGRVHLRTDAAVGGPARIPHPATRTSGALSGQVVRRPLRRFGGPGEFPSRSGHLDRGCQADGAHRTGQPLRGRQPRARSLVRSVAGAAADASYTRCHQRQLDGGRGGGGHGALGGAAAPPQPRAARAEFARVRPAQAAVAPVDCGDRRRRHRLCLAVRRAERRDGSRLRCRLQPALPAAVAAIGRQRPSRHNHRPDAQRWPREALAVLWQRYGWRAVRLAVPVVGALALYAWQRDAWRPSLVLAFVLGFLSYKVPLLAMSARELYEAYQESRQGARRSSGRARSYGPSATAASRAVPTSSATASGPATPLYPAIVVAGPSGVGKSSLIGQLLRAFPDRLGYSVSSTTRPPRDGEVDGTSYHFLTREQFERDVTEGKFIEHAHIYGNHYGTSVDAPGSAGRAGDAAAVEPADVFRVDRSAVVGGAGAAAARAQHRRRGDAAATVAGGAARDASSGGDVDI
eukprot:ctg_366.g213